MKKLNLKLIAVSEREIDQKDKRLDAKTFPVPYALGEIKKILLLLQIHLLNDLSRK